MERECIQVGILSTIRQAEQYVAQRQYYNASSTYLATSALAGIMLSCSPAEESSRYEAIISETNTKARSNLDWFKRDLPTVIERSEDVQRLEKAVIRYEAKDCDEIVHENNNLRDMLAKLANETGNEAVAKGILSSKTASEIAQWTGQLTSKAAEWFTRGAPGAPGAPPDKDRCPTEEALQKPASLEKALTFDQIIGLDVAKKRFISEVVNPLQFPEVAKATKTRSANALLYGPGGTGKTTIIEAAAKITDTPMLNVSSADIKGAWVGQTEKCLKAMMESGRKLNAIVFLDEVDAILAGDSAIEKSAQSAFKQLVQPGDNQPPPVITAATNRPWDITDDAVQRRFELKLYISLPTPGQRKWYLSQILGKTLCDPCTQKPLDLMRMFTPGQWQQILQWTRGFTPADLKTLFRVARSHAKVSLGNIQEVGFVPSTEPPGFWDARPLQDARTNPAYKTITQMSQSEREKICWPFVSYQDFANVLETNQVRANVTVESLKKYLDYAVQVKDNPSITEIQRSMNEINGSKPIDFVEVNAYMDQMVREKQVELLRLEQACKRST